jgi:oxygen-independent coproporphyrinogen III oxidase
VHVQNVDTWEAYLDKLERGEIPLGRAFPTTALDRLVREVILQLKTGRIEPKYFAGKFGVDVLAALHDPFAKLQAEGWLTLSADAVTLTPAGFLQIDRHLPAFFDPQYVGKRYT